MARKYGYKIQNRRAQKHDFKTVAGYFDDFFAFFGQTQLHNIAINAKISHTVPDESYGFWADLLIDGHV